MSPSRSSTALPGILYAVLAYGAWGIFPLYWKLFAGVPPVEIVCHRVIWSLVFLTALVLVLRQQNEIRRLFGSPKILGVLLLTSLLLSLNWGIFVFGVNSGRIVETSLGYFIVPLVNVGLGYGILREKLTGQQILAFVLAAAGVVVFASHLGSVPWIALGLAATFSLYGLLRKVVAASPLAGIFVETALMAPPALIVLALLGSREPSHVVNSRYLMLLFLGGGMVTSLPLLWFNRAVKLLPLSTLGFFQYLAPSLQLLVGIAIYHEPFSAHKLAAFAMIWLAIALNLRSALQVATPLAD
jgi:chloramphenicol-sensitive protein RarD